MADDATKPEYKRTTALSRMWKRALSLGGRGGPITVRRPNRGPWVQPEGMSDDLAERVARGEMCGAKLAGRNGWCKQWPHKRTAIIPRRCRHHGGAGGAPKGNKHALTHGFYSDALSDEEKSRWNDIEVNSLEEEIKLTKTRLQRAVKLERLQEIVLTSGDEQQLLAAMVLYEEHIKDAVDWERRTIRRLVDYKKIIHDIQRSLAQFITQQIALEQAGHADDSPDEMADAIKNAVGNMHLTLNVTATDPSSE